MASFILLLISTCLRSWILQLKHVNSKPGIPSILLLQM